ncbi:MAG: PKD domain-containing protein [Flavobacteriales bacterium]|nr:PKD domain-containing protein [Flavobacteriales bacterium]
MKGIFITFLIVLLSLSAAIAQGTSCSTTLLNEPFDTSVIVGVNGAVLYGTGGSNHNASMIMSGAYFGWFNIQSGITNVDIYDRQVTGVSVGCEVSASMWIRESYGGTNVTLSLEDNYGTVLDDITLTLNGVYQQITLTGIATSPTIHYVIHFNSVGGNGMDIATEDLVITQTCMGEADIVAQTPQCLLGNSFLFDGTNSTADAGIATYLWDFGDGNNGAGANPTHNYAASGSYNVTLRVTDINGCQDESSILVDVKETPVVDFTVLNPLGCAPINTEFSNNSSGIDSGAICTWDFGDGNTYSGCGAANHVYQDDGCYDVTLSINSNGCSSSLTHVDLVCAEDQPIASFTYNPSTLFIEDPSVTFLNQSQNATNYSWSFGDGGASISENPSHVYSTMKSGHYTTVLYAYNDIGCVDSAFQVVKVQGYQAYYIPNSFTPDGDQYNQYFQPVFTSGYDPDSFHMAIFNRWGELMFESYNVAVGWDGTCKSGSFVENGVYIWKIEIKDAFTNEKCELYGHVNVLK